MRPSHREMVRIRHEAELTGDFSARKRSEHTFLTDLETKLHCSRCSNRKGNTLEVRLAARN